MLGREPKKAGEPTRQTYAPTLLTCVGTYAPHLRWHLHSYRQHSRDRPSPRAFGPRTRGSSGVLRLSYARNFLRAPQAKIFTILHRYKRRRAGLKTPPFYARRRRFLFFILFYTFYFFENTPPATLPTARACVQKK